MVVVIASSKDKTGKTITTIGFAPATGNRLADYMICGEDKPNLHVPLTSRVQKG